MRKKLKEELSPTVRLRFGTHTNLQTFDMNLHRNSDEISRKNCLHFSICHANLLCVVPILTDDPRRDSKPKLSCKLKTRTRSFLFGAHETNSHGGLQPNRLSAAKRRAKIIVNHPTRVWSMQPRPPLDAFQEYHLDSAKKSPEISWTKS